MSYSDAALLMKHIRRNPPTYVLTAMRYGFYEQRAKQEKAQEMQDLSALRTVNRKPTRTFDSLPPEIQKRQMERIARYRKQGVPE